MCGICGIFDAEGQGERWGILARKMNSAIAHRGPEDEGFLDTPNCILGHRRLKIIDLSPLGRQPMCNEDGTVWVSFNGEIYNYKQLRSQLVSRGHQFRTQTDTEVMVHLYEEKGEGFLSEINGMFAISLWDSRRKRLLLARDRFGKKPLYYHSDGKRLLFGSELKAILADPTAPREIDHDALSEYLSFGYVACPRSIFKSIKKVPPASWISIERNSSGDQIRIDGPHSYWALRFRANHSLEENECVAQIRELISDSVRIRLQADVPLGAFLSGGLDSSTVVAAMAAAEDKPVETFSVGFDDSSFDELHYAEIIAKKFNTNHHVLHCTPNALEILPQLVHHYDEPFADSSALPTFAISKLARERTTVILSGDGGDEVFAGYERYAQGMQYRNRRRTPMGAAERGVYSQIAAAYPVNLRGWGWLNKRSLRPLDSYIADLWMIQPEQRRKLLMPKWNAGIHEDLGAVAHAAARETSDGNHLSDMQAIDVRLYLPDDILVKVDRASMAVALETRAPLLDYRLAEFMFTVPEELRFRGGVKKYLLKKAVRGVLPDEIIDRPKMGFGVPLRTWFRGETSNFLRDTLLSQRAQERGIFRRSELARLVDGHGNAGRDLSSGIWVTVFFELWCQHWLDRAPGDDHRDANMDPALAPAVN